MTERHKLICASYLILVEGNDVLLLRRFNTGYEDGKYSLPAGHVEENESVADCLVREAKEEINIDIDKKYVSLRHVMHRRASEQNDERLDLFFTCDKWSGEIKNLEPSKCDELKWFNLNNLPDNVIPYIRLAIENSLKAPISYSEI